MKFRPMAELLADALSRGYAVPSFCAWNGEMMDIVLRVAEDLQAPVVLMHGPGDFPVMDADLTGAVAHTVARRYSIPAALHLDHGDSPEIVAACLAARYTSVMLDYSSRPFAENAAALREVVKLAHPRGVTVEGELGHVGKADTVTVEGDGDSTLTNPDQAAAFVEQTGIDALAVSIGNAHGHYTKLPAFDFERLAQIRAVVGVPLVLHGGSGTPEADLKRAISLGMALREGLIAELGAAQKHWLPMSLADAARRVPAVVEKWIRLTGAAGRA